MAKLKKKSLSFEESEFENGSGSTNSNSSSSSWKRRFSFAGNNDSHGNNGSGGGGSGGGGGNNGDGCGNISSLGQDIRSNFSELAKLPSKSAALIRRTSFDSLRSRLANSYEMMRSTSTPSSITTTQGHKRKKMNWNAPSAIGIEWTSQVHHIVTDLLRSYFVTSPTDRLPPDVLEEIFRYNIYIEINR